GAVADIEIPGLQLGEAVRLALMARRIGQGEVERLLPVYVIRRDDLPVKFIRRDPARPPRGNGISAGPGAIDPDGPVFAEGELFLETSIPSLDRRRRCAGPCRSFQGQARGLSGSGGGAHPEAAEREYDVECHQVFVCVRLTARREISFTRWVDFSF